MKNQKKLGLSLRGGGARCASYLGVIKALEENDIEIHAIVGASGGAIAGGSYASFKDIEKGIKHFESINPKNVLGIDAFREGSIVSVSKTVELAKELTKNIQMQETQIPIYIQATNFDTGDNEIFDSGSLAVKITASSAVPGVVRPIRIKGKRYIDGDFSSGFANSFLKSKGVDVTIGMCPNYAFDVEEHTGKMLNSFRPYDILIKQIRTMDQTIDPVDYMLENLGEGFELHEFSKAREIAEHGYKHAMEKMEEIVELLTPDS